MSDATELTLYGKPDCHLCDEAETLLRSLAVEQPLHYRKIDIQSAPDLFERYRYRIPVIELPDGVTLDWPVTTGQIRRALAAAARRP
ncbi:MAG: glutaredoxin family protein [Chloroflexota bacterium]